MSGAGSRATTQVAVAVLACAIAAWLLVSAGTHALILATIGLLAAATLLRWPALTVLTLLVTCQELDPAQGFGGPGASSLLFLGHQIYFTTVARFSVITLIMLAAAASVSATRRLGPSRLIAVVLVLSIGAYYAMRIWADGGSLTSAINQDARFAILFGAAYVVGAAAARSSDWARHSVPLFTSLMLAMALIGAYLRATGQGETTTGTGLVFYDSAMGALAGAAVLAVLSMPASWRDWRIWLLGAAALVVVVLSSRRDVWAAMIVALLLGLVFSYGRMRLVLRLLGVAALAAVIVAAFFPSAMTAFGHQLSQIWGATQGTAADSSTRGHLSDIRIGWNAVKASPISGVGPGGYVAGLVLETSPLYIHNHILESWLRFGLLAAVLVVAVQLVLVVQALATIARPDVDFTKRWAAELLLMAPVSMLTAPFLTNTQRWPTLLGLAAGLVGAQPGPAGQARAVTLARQPVARTGP